MVNCLDTTSCGALPWRRGPKGTFQVLLIKQFAHKDRWGVPKGHVNAGEAHEACAVREVKEETGLIVELGARLDVIVFNSRRERKTVYLWLASVVGPSDPVLGDPNNEVADARWFDVEVLPELVTYQRALIEATVRHLPAMVATA